MVPARRYGYASDANCSGVISDKTVWRDVWIWSKSSTLLVRDNLGQPRVAQCKLLPQGRGAMAPTVVGPSTDAGTGHRWRSLSRRIWAGQSESPCGRNHRLCPTLLQHLYLYGAEWLADLDRRGIDGRQEEWATQRLTTLTIPKCSVPSFEDGNYPLQQSKFMNSTGSFSQETTADLVTFYVSLFNPGGHRLESG
jgi:hypothetical protein